MNGTSFDTLVRSLMGGTISRRAAGQGLVGVALATGVAQLGLDELDARKKGKGKKRKNNKRQGRGNGNGGDNDDGGGDDGGDNGGGNPCNGTICNGQCVDLNTDSNNCGACGTLCRNAVPCAGGRCVNVIGRQ